MEHLEAQESLEQHWVRPNAVNLSFSPRAALHLADSQDGLNRVAALSVGDGPVDLAEVIYLHEAIKGKLSRLVERDQFRDKALRHGAPLDDADDFPPLPQRLCGVRVGYHRHGAIRIEHVNGELVHLWVTGDFQHVIDSAAGDSGDAGGDVITTIVDRVRGAQLQSEFEPHGVYVDAYDRVCADDAGRHDRGQADRSGTEDGYARPLRDFQRVHHGAGPRLHAATKRSEDLQRQVFGNSDKVTFGHQRAGGEGRLTEEVPMNAAPLQRVATVKAFEAEVRFVEVLAIGRVSTAALTATPA